MFKIKITTRSSQTIIIAIIIVMISTLKLFTKYMNTNNVSLVPVGLMARCPLTYESNGLLTCLLFLCHLNSFYDYVIIKYGFVQLAIIHNTRADASKINTAVVTCEMCQITVVLILLTRRLKVYCEKNLFCLYQYNLELVIFT